MSPVSGARVLVVDDEPAILRAVTTNLIHHGFLVQSAENGRDALDRYASFRADLVILDLGLPDLDGLEIIRTIRAQASTPIIILSVRGAERDKIDALDLGADDYLTKPFGIGELLARVRVALRHLARPESGTVALVRIGKLAVDLEQRLVRVAGQEVHLSPIEYDLLKAFLSAPNKVLTEQKLLQHVWGLDTGSESHYLHVYIARLRKKLDRGPDSPALIVTEPGVGYRLVDEAS